MTIDQDLEAHIEDLLAIHKIDPAVGWAMVADFSDIRARLEHHRATSRTNHPSQYTPPIIESIEIPPLVEAIEVYATKGRRPPVVPPEWDDPEWSRKMGIT